MGAKSTIFPIVIAPAYAPASAGVSSERARTASMFVYLGARATPIPQLPQVPSGTRSNAVMSSQRVID